MILPTTLALASTMVLTPGVRRIALALGVVDKPASRKFHVVSTPYLGGLAIIVGVLLANVVTDRLPYIGWQLVGLALLIALLGLWDDVRPLAWRPKLAIEVVAAVAAAVVTWAAIPDSEQRASTAAALALGVGAIVLMTNSFNLLDNIDAHSASIALSSNVGIALIALDSLVFDGIAALPLTIAAACVAFLMFNLSTRLKIFLGDSGSLMLGFATTSAAVLVLSTGPTVEYLVSMTLLLLVPALDTATVVFDRNRNGVPVFTPGKDHLSHRLVRLGLSPRQSVAAWALLQLVSSLVAYWIVAGDQQLRWLAVSIPLALAATAVGLALRVSDLYERSDSVPAG